MPIVLDGTNGINTPDLESAGPISGTTGTFSGAVSGTTGTFSGAVQASGVAANLYPLVSATAVASTSGTSIDFTGIPSWVKRITVMFSGVSTSGTSNILIQIGDSGGIEVTGYASGFGTRTNESVSTAGFVVGTTAAAANTLTGLIPIANIGPNAWVTSGVLSRSDGFANNSGGSKTLSDTLTQVRITTVNGTDTFDAGSINILYE